LQIGGIDFAAITKGNRAFQDVFEFPDVARKTVAGQGAERIGGQLGDRYTKSPWIGITIESGYFSDKVMKL